jgi:chemotaxis response regulator CheB
MPDDSGMAFVVIQHLDPSHVSYMAGLLTKHSENGGGSD